MKKIIYLLLFVFGSALTITSCTEEEIAPTVESNGGGEGSADGGF